MPGHPSQEDSRRQFTIKDSGSRAEFEGGMVRDNAGDKTDYTGSFIGPMWRRWAVHQTKGRAKYPDPEPGVPNWTLASGIDELIHAKRSLLRHITAYMENEEDEDHAAAIFFNINLIEYIKDKLAAAPDEPQITDATQWADEAVDQGLFGCTPDSPAGDGDGGNGFPGKSPGENDGNHYVPSWLRDRTDRGSGFVRRRRV